MTQSRLKLFDKPFALGDSLLKLDFPLVSSPKKIRCSFGAKISRVCSRKDLTNGFFEKWQGFFSFSSSFILRLQLLTHLAPDCLSPPALFPYRETPDRLVAAGQQMPHTSISAYANRNGILARLVASFLLSFTTSGDVVCLKFGEV